MKKLKRTIVRGGDGVRLAVWRCTCADCRARDKHVQRLAWVTDRATFPVRR